MSVTHLVIDPQVRAWVRSTAIPEISYILPGLAGLPQNHMAFPMLLGFLATGASVLKGRMIGLSSDGKHHYTAIPILHTLEVRRVVLHVQQWKMRENHWQSIRSMVFPCSHPEQGQAVEIPEHTPDRIKLMIYRQQAILCLEKLFAEVNLIPCTKEQNAFTSLMFLRFHSS